MNAQTSYIIDANRNTREKYAVRQAVRTGVLRENVALPLGIGALSWWLLECDTQWTKRKPGDIDILVGTLSFRDPTALAKASEQLRQENPHWPNTLVSGLAPNKAAADGAITWPPGMDVLIGMEAKCAYFKDGKPHSAKQYDEDVANMREQLDGLFLLGLDRVALLDVIANEPTEGGQQVNAWIEAAARAHDSLSSMDQALRARLPDESFAGHFAMPLGAVIGGNESCRGAVHLRILRSGLPNPHPRGDNAPVQQTRRMLEQKVQRLLADTTQPRSFPVLLVQCSACKRVHYLDEGVCPLNQPHSLE
jgi:hypothetical protein